MESSSPPRNTDQYERVRIFSSEFTLLIACLVIFGWVLNISILKSLLPGLPEMKPNTALALLLAAVSLYSCSRDARRLKRYFSAGCALITLAIGVVTIAEYLARRNLAIDEFLFRGSQGPELLRMSVHSAVSIFLVGLSLLLLNGRKRLFSILSDSSAFAVLAMALTALLGHLYHARLLYGGSSSSGMALHTAFSFVSIAVGTLAANRQRLIAILTSNSVGGIMARRLLPAALLVPAILGWLRIQGQDLGWYDAGIGTALMIVACILLLATFIFYNMVILDRIDAERRQATDELRHSEQRYRQLVEGSRGFMCEHDMDGRLLTVNAATLQALGYQAGEMIGKNLIDFMSPSFNEHISSYLDRMARNSTDTGLMFIKTKDGGERVWKYHNVKHAERDYVIGHAQDVTELQEVQEHLKSLSITDDLTGLYNRRGFFTLAEQYFKLRRRTKERLIVLFADIDNLKQINDRFGHAAGSQAIIKTGEILRSVFRDTDIIARLGGDEFVVLMINTAADSDQIVSARLHEKIADFNAGGEQPYRLSISFGLESVDGSSTLTVEEMITAADKAMYEQKRKKQDEKSLVSENPGLSPASV
jgi:diguanylate cyclase (GGDEF)-like protein/PAS domain S-box-containing protein